MKILDCTLRDGGYVNNWRFLEDTFKRVIDVDEQIGVDIVEIGIIGEQNNSENEFSTRYFDFTCIPKLPRHSANLEIAIMGSLNEFRKINIPDARQTGVTIIRVAYFKKDYIEAINLVSELKEKGYKVFLQAMATFMYTSRELIDMIERINHVKPTAFYIVDSFGTMYPIDVEEIYEKIRSKLAVDISIGFHAHNNMQLALANTLKFVEIADDSAFIDASYYGMGRGAGNLNLECLLRYLNEKKQTKYDLNKCCSLIEEVFVPEMIENPWGYTMPYFYSSMYRVNVAYVWYIQNMGIKDPRLIRHILEQIPDECKYTLNRNIIESIMTN